MKIGFCTLAAFFLILSPLGYPQESIRRVITSEDAHGQAYIYIDDSTPHLIRRGNFAMGEIWANERHVIDTIESDLAEGRTGKTPQSGHSLMRYVVLPPDSEMVQLLKNESSTKSKSEIRTEPNNSGMHQTNTIDYGFVLQGSIVLDLGAEKVELKAGDSFVQNGTRHAWRNPGSTSAVIGVVMIGAERPATHNERLQRTPASGLR